MPLSQQVCTFFNGDNLLLISKCITIASMGIGAGAGVAMNGTIMPTLTKLSGASAVSFWSQMAHPAKMTQLSSLITAFLGGVGVYYKTKNKYFLYGSLLMLSIIPYTVVMFLPINRELFAFAKSGLADVDGSFARKIVTWNRNQYGRTALNFAALFTTLYGALKEGEGDNKEKPE
ncbi:hypothetical protein EMPS_05296 [Entomortierella parvispora]|uniref:Uncharacterized protein n=1 Tax=Entomortierella parvispora TaxID=205924 RepID=A0A9P3LWC6_9FUNG|nr:hypothetical protein EMPS_05296 [Entomortierella parvispora]